jgi:hypothetical protein
VHVHGRPHGRRYDQGLNEHECDEPAHEDSLPEQHPAASYPSS